MEDRRYLEYADCLNYSLASLRAFSLLLCLVHDALPDDLPSCFSEADFRRAEDYLISFIAQYATESSVSWSYFCDSVSDILRSSLPV